MQRQVKVLFYSLNEVIGLSSCQFCSLHIAIKTLKFVLSNIQPDKMKKMLS
jgi:hypothetical protein